MTVGAVIVPGRAVIELLTRSTDKLLLTCHEESEFVRLLADA